MHNIKDNLFELLLLILCVKLLIYPQWELSAAILIISTAICFKKYSDKEKLSEIDALKKDIQLLKDKVGMISLGRSMS